MTNARFLLPTLGLILALSTAAPATADDPQPDPNTTYRFERLWPTLQQPWYLSSPRGIALDDQGMVYVADTYNARICKLTCDGQFVCDWGSWGTDPGEFRWPSAIAIDSIGTVYVADFELHCIHKFTSDGVFLAKWGSYGTGNGEFDEPSGIAVDCAGRVYVADTNNQRIQVFDSNGAYLDQWGGLGADQGQFNNPRGVEVDHDGNVYVADAYNHRIQKFTADGDFLVAWGTGGSGPGQLAYPSDVTLDSTGTVYVSDTNNGRIQSFTPDGEFLGMWGSWGVGPGEFRQPTGIVLDRAGRVYVAEKANDRVQRFTSEGEFLGAWGSVGSTSGHFHGPNDVALDSAGVLYVADRTNDRIQKFTSDGVFLLEWGNYGTAPGEFRSPDGVAVDDAGAVYVADQSNCRIQKFTSDGVFLLEWGNYGTGPGEFSCPRGLAVDDAEEVYVADTWSHRVEKFTAAGEFLLQWGSEGSSPGEFSRPDGIAVDGAGTVYVADTRNHRIQKFTPDGGFLDEWPSIGSGEDWSELGGPFGVAVDSAGAVYVAGWASYYDRIQKFTSDGELVIEWCAWGAGAGQVNEPMAIAINNDGVVYVADRANNRIQKFRPLVLSENAKAFVVAGGGPYPGNTLWDDTQASTNFAYRALNHQGFTKDTIYYLSSDMDLDLDNNGVADDVDADCTCANLQDALETWGPAHLDGLPTSDVVVYLCNHGAPGTFRMSGTEILAASNLAAWLDTLQAGITGTLTVVIDACESGTFVDDLAGSGRIIITSTSPGESAYFVTTGTVSFSSYFWTQIFNGLSIGDSFTAAAQALSQTFTYQTPLLDDTGNGIANEPADGTIAATTYIGNGTRQWWEGPEIDAVSAPQSIDATATATLWADPVTDDDGIARVWAVIRPPDYELESTSTPVIGLPSIDLMPAGGDRYEADYSAFTTEGTYDILIYARDRVGNTSEPQPTSVTVTNPLSRKALIVAGGHTINGSTLDSRWPATEYNADLAYDALTFQGYGDDDVYYLSHTTTAGVDALAVLSNIDWAINTWAASNTQDLTLYLVGYGQDGAFEINDTEQLTAAQLDAWLDTLQATLPGKVTLVNDADCAGSFLPATIPPTGADRIVIASTGATGAAHFLADGKVSFSRFFWGHVAGGATTLQAFSYAAEAMGSTAQLDDDGDGAYSTKLDGRIALRYLLGSGILLADDNPLVGTVAPDATLSGSPTGLLWAEQVTTTRSIQAVFAIIHPPYHEDTRTLLPQSTLPTVSLTLTGTGDRRYEGTWDGFWALGDYTVDIYAIDDQDSVSMPITMTVQQTAGLGDGDTDGDGIPDNVEGPGDIDGDGQLNYADLDSDGDSLLDADEFHEDPEWDDLDGDGLLNCYDTDSDGDGLADDYETATGTDPYDPDDPPPTPIHRAAIVLIVLALAWFGGLALHRFRRLNRSRSPLAKTP